MLRTAAEWRLEDIAYTEAGLEHRDSSPRFLLVHGLGGARRQWCTVQEQLARHAYSIAVDVPGFGDSRTRDRFDVHGATRKLARFVRHRGLDDCVLVSHSIGSTVAALLAADGGMRFQRSILVSGTLFRAVGVAQRPWQMLTRGRLGLTVAAQFLVGMIPVSAAARRLLAASRWVRRLALWPFVAAPHALDPHCVARALEGSGSPTVLRVLLDARRIDFPAMVGAIPHPVDLVWGAHDRLINAEDIVTAAGLCDVANRHEIRDCGHWPMIERTEELVALFLKWGSR
ncbi:alpha/beta hydrolase [Catellatospora sp. NPDC049111]|uniref:alpha/beta fold hydrolase n=1 Tax=Catellatospora sp. NPDC049111 TaxID=3155271 RepID=UPI0033E4DE30